MSDEISEFIKKESRSSEDFRKLDAVNQERNVCKSRKDGDKVKTEKMDQASQSVDRVVKL